ncbi:unnamed protein product [Psylliodes chrysocephalus]|uniref:C2H2-type domain-containing protein n=1 Tax=Psylliodes chrysocephalus TaxID=3402493 RepID=A0A9P0D7B7_9CUCU|nr:unnamed protein product [Psylliodes chrysocephala]
MAEEVIELLQSWNIPDEVINKFSECYHNSNTNYFVCPIPSCSRIYHRKNSLKQHMNTIHQANFCHDNLAKNTDDENIINESYSTSDTHIEDNILCESVAVTEGVPRSVIQTLIESVSAFMSSGLIDKILESLLDFFPCHTKSTSFEYIKSMLKLMENPFSSLDTEYKRFKHFQKSDKLFMPQEIFLGVSEDQQLKKEYSENNVLRNIIHGSNWSSKFHSEILPLVLYYDDFERGNPLGSHAGNYKISDIYFFIATLPPDHLSKLENIFVTFLVHSIDKIKFGNSVFQVIVNELSLLETEGINIRVNGTLVNVKFALAAISGDNLGVHGILGLFESFSATHFCRFCTIPKEETVTVTHELQDYLRKVSDYADHLNRKLGVKEQCIWNSLPNFHLYKNSTCDVSILH